MTDEATINSKRLSYKSLNDIRDVKSMGLYPYFREISATHDNIVTIDGKDLLMMGSTVTSDSQIIRKSKKPP